MSYSYTRTATFTFTLTHARHLSSKVAADLHLCSLYYGHPSEEHTRNLSEELALLLKDRYVDRYEFGYKRNSTRVLCWRYSVSFDGTITADDRAGKLLSSANVDNASFYTYLWYSTKWSDLSQDEQEKVEKTLPIMRNTCEPPADGQGYWTGIDKNYSSGGTAFSRNTFRPY